MDFIFDTIPSALEDLRNGKILIVVDDEDRENEGDFIVASESITPEIVNFMETHGRGLLCTPITVERCKELDLPMMVSENTSIHSTPFTISIDLLGNGCSTGISAHDRAESIKALANKSTLPEDYGRPGHIFPLRARPGGVLERAGHTEAVVDLTRLANMYPAGALIEIKNEDGSMARLPELIQLAQKYNLKIITIKDLITYRLKTESLIQKEEETFLPTEWGDFQLIVYRQKNNNLLHLALKKGDWEKDEKVLVRVHSSCATGDIFGSCRCDCGSQLHEAMKAVEKEGKGLVVYMNQEGRGIGLLNKIKAYKLQDMGRDTIEANIELGFKADERDYGVGAQILRDLNAAKIRLMTNNPVKRLGLEGYGISIVETVPIIIKTNPYNEKYMETKKTKMGHTI